MKMTRSTTLVLSALMAMSMLATSCEPKETATDNTIDLTPAFESGDTVNFYDMLDTAYVVKLETSDECLIGGYPEYRVFDKYICVFEKYTMPSTAMLFFDRNGKFVKSIIRGNGPGEIQGYITDITDDKNRNRLIISDGSSRLKYFDYDLNYIGSSDFPNCRGIAVAGDKYVLSVGFYDQGHPEWGEYSDCKIIVTDTNINVVEGYVHYKYDWSSDPNEYVIILGGSFGQGNDGVYYQEIQWDTLYVYNTAFHAFAVNFPDKARISMEEINSGNTQYDNKHFVIRVAVFDDYILFRIQPSNIVLYSKLTRESVMLTTVPSEDFRFGNCMVEPFSHEDFERCKNNDESKLPDLKRILSESDYAKLESLTEDDNPVLIFYQLKKTLE